MMQRISTRRLVRFVVTPRTNMSRASRRYSSQPRDASSTMDRMASRTPRFLRRYLEPLRHAPLTHVTAFLLLHEITAIVPLFGLAGAFHYYNYLPAYISEGKWVSDGVEKFGRYFRRKGWLGDVDETTGLVTGGRARWWDRGEGGVRIVTELATAYAITKALLPFRLVLSVWATPWFARVAVKPVTSVFARMFRKKGGGLSAAAAPNKSIQRPSGAAARTGTTEAGVTK